MDIPFKYIMLCIIRDLNERGIRLVIDKTTLLNYIAVVVGELLYTPEEKKELGKKFDFQYELDDLLNKYVKYFDIDDNKIIFDIDYIDELSDLIEDETEDFDKEIIDDFNYAIEGNTMLLDILGVKINKDLYNFLLDIERNIEECYDDLYTLESNIFDISKNKEEICDKLKMLHMKKIVMIVNSKNLLSEIEYYDLMQYSSNIVDKINDEEDLNLLCESEQFNAADIVSDVFLRSIFTNNDSYICNLDETFIVNNLETEIDTNEKYNKIKFYTTLLALIDREINSSYGLLKNELIKIKYRVMNTLDSAYGSSIFLNNCSDLNDNYVENYEFIVETVYYFVKEMLMYDDEKYRNKNCDTDNIMMYVDNIMKKLLIETYYKLTSDEALVEDIKGNKLYGVNGISSGLLKDIVDKPKTKIKEV